MDISFGLSINGTFSILITEGKKNMGGVILYEKWDFENESRPAGCYMIRCWQLPYGEMGPHNHKVTF